MSLNQQPEKHPDYFMSVYLRIKNWFFIRSQNESLSTSLAILVSLILVIALGAVVFAIAHQIFGSPVVLKS